MTLLIVYLASCIVMYPIAEVLAENCLTMSYKKDIQQFKEFADFYIGKVEKNDWKSYFERYCTKLVCAVLWPLTMIYVIILMAITK